MASKVKVQFQGKEWEFENVNITPEMIKTALAPQAPEIINANYTRKEEGDYIIYTFTKQIGTKG